MEVSSDDYVEPQWLSGMIMGGLNSESSETPLPKKKRKITREEHNQERARASASEESLASLSASQADVFDKFCLRGKLVSPTQL